MLFNFHSCTSYFDCLFNKTKKTAVDSDCGHDYDLVLSDNEFVHSGDEAITIVHITHTHCLYTTEVQFKGILRFPVMNT